MKKIGIFYGTETKKTAEAAQKILEAFGNTKIYVVSVEKAWEKDFESYDILIIGVATWFDGELPTYWDEFLPELESLNLKGKKVAIFGLGDQVNYPDNFVDGMGILAETFIKCGAAIIGQTSTIGYQFNQSQAVKNHQFSGLVLDFENQADKTDERIRDWVEQLGKDIV